MSTEAESLSHNWKRPDELIKLQRLRQKKKQLNERISKTKRPDITDVDKTQLLEAKVSQKRKNPFAKNNDNAKKSKIELSNVQEDSLLEFVNTPPTQHQSFIAETPILPVPAKFVPKSYDGQAFSNMLKKSSVTAAEEDEGALEEQQYTKHLPMDWCLKTRVRFFCRTELPTTTLKTSQMASGLTSFVRCIDVQNTCSGLDISPATRFNQATYYWQHPHLPWLTLFPRNAKENTGITLGERERKTLLADWDCSFRGLFQLLRARQCPYFYLCANTFTVLFRAAGTAGRVETHALMTPSTRGMRSALRQEGIEYTMPLKMNDLNKSDDGNFTDESKDALFSMNEDGTVDTTTLDDEEDDGENWLAELGVDEKEIRRIQTAHSRKIKAQEMTDDFSDNSLLLIEGVECQGFFSFLLNAKSTISSVGRLAGVPPTLLSPVGFPKATMLNLTTRSNKVRMDGVDYCSIEVKGTVLPTFLPYICQLLGETKDTFSATMASSNNTLAFSKATKKLLEAPVETKCEEELQHLVLDDKAAGQVFGQENLSDCGLISDVIECMCRTGTSAVSLLERVCYDKNCGYAWS